VWKVKPEFNHPPAADFTHHSLRHYVVSNAIEAGVDFKTIAAWVGGMGGVRLRILM